MSKFVIDLREPLPEPAADIDVGPAIFEGIVARPRRIRLRKVLFGTAAVLLFAGVVSAVAGYFYWQSFKATPQYSLALIVDAARRGDKQTTTELVDINAVVDDFVPQITAKAVEIYGRGLPPDTVARVTRIASPLMPALKDRARAELPNVIRNRTEKLQSVPFFALVLGADRYLDIKVDGDTAVVTSKMADRPFEMKMTRSGDRWRIAGVKDDQLAEMIAKKVGQEIIAVATKGGVSAAGNKLGIQNLSDILKQAEEIFH